MKLAIFGVIAFVIGLGGSTGVLVFTAPAHSPAADSLAVAKAHPGAAAHPATTTAPVATASVHVPVPVTTAVTATDTSHANAHAAAPATVAASTEGAHAPVVTAVPPAALAHALPPMPDAESYKQVGSILLNMKPAEAARIVAYLNDDQVEGLLRSMSSRQAAVVFGQLPPERAAGLSRRLLLPAKEERP